jgi:GT2 family glycosyltransferase
MARCALSIVIVNFNSGSYLPACLDSLRAQTFRDFEIIIVDNASSDRSMECLDGYPEVRTAQNGINRGFAAGQNQGFALAAGRHILALNFDLLMRTTFLEELVRALEEASDVGWVCGKLMNMTADGTATDTIYAVGHQLPADRFSWLRGSGEADRGQYDSPEYVFGAPGAAALYRREMVEDISFHGQFFDESFFTWWEDVDLDWRAQSRGWRCLYVPSAVAYHVGHAGEEYQEPFRTWRATVGIRNRWLTIAANETIAGFRRNASALVRYELSSMLYVMRSGLVRAYLRALVGFVRDWPHTRAKRHWVQSRAGRRFQPQDS